ncbi:MAG: coproporphyrinogen III oxidase family protein [Planctomycetes bacterium]|nr:coproporphyrinogen III oxidase family protein [Planctomycetota bacterium]
MSPETRAEATKAGNYFVSNYPPYSFWRPEHVPAVARMLAEPAPADVSLGIYVHIPFCRQRCDFCYFKVYTDKNSKEIRRYLEGLRRELALYAPAPRFRGREVRFVYFGGGTPSYLSAEQLTELFESVRAAFAWDAVEEVAFECEPGTLSEAKLAELKRLGVTRLSLGVENFDPHILEINNRAHRAAEIHKTWHAARAVGFEQINIDLIAGMVGENEANWKDCVEQTIALGPESVTIYQLEVPYNTTLFQRMQEEHSEAAPVADWETKRRWTAEAFARLEAAGYRIGSAYTAARGERTRFVYRDELWRGADLLGIGVSSFSHVGGVHFQNEHEFERYLERVEAGELPVGRALELGAEERMIREFVLQMKLGRVETAYFARKFGVDLLRRFRAPLEAQRAAGWLTFTPELIRTTRAGLLRVDTLLADYFLAAHQNARYA